MGTRIGGADPSDESMHWICARMSWFGQEKIGVVHNAIAGCWADLGGGEPSEGGRVLYLFKRR